MAMAPALLTQPTRTTREDHARILLRVEAALATSLDYRATLKAFAWQLVPTLADWCLVDLIDPPGTVRRVAVAYADPGKSALGEVMARHPFRGLASGPITPIFRGECVIHDINEQVIIDASHNEAHAVAMRAVGGSAFLLAPLQDPNGRLMGIVVLISAESGRRFEERELTLASALATRVSRAVNASRRYEAAGISSELGERVAERAARLQATAAAFSEALTPRQVADIALRQVVSSLGARSGSIGVLSADGAIIQILGITGYPPATAAGWQRIGTAEPFPISDVVRTGEPLFLSSASERNKHYPHLAAVMADGGGDAMATVPLVTDDRPFGAISLNFTTGQSFEDDDRAFVQALARMSAVALERARLLEAESLSRERMAVVAEASRVLGSALDYDTTLRNVAMMTTPVLADFAFFDLDEGEGHVRRVAHAHQDPYRQALLDSTRWVRSDRTDTVLCALEAGRTGYHPDIDDAWMRDVATSPPHLAMLRDLKLCSFVTVPLSSDGVTIGALTVCHGPSGRHHTTSDVQLAEELAHRATAAVQNARLLKQAREAVVHRDAFLAMASHELNTPLTALKLQLASISRKGADPGKHADRVTSAVRQTTRLARLVQEMLDVSRVSAGKLTLEREPVDLGELVSDVVARHGDEITRAVNTVTLNVSEVVVVSCDRLRIDQVVTNLLTNALKYGGGKPIEISIARDAEGVRLVVRDHGIGIGAEHQARIFNRFERAVSVRHYGGFGLGLWIVRQVVEAHGGSIAVESKPDEGSTFTVSLPDVARTA